VDKAMKHKKSIGLRVILALVAVAIGITVQVAGSGFSKMIDIAALEYIIGLLGFILMGYLIYKWSIK
jgi:hypothetical protein